MSELNWFVCVADASGPVAFERFESEAGAKATARLMEKIILAQSDKGQVYWGEVRGCVSVGALIGGKQ